MVLRIKYAVIEEIRASSDKSFERIYVKVSNMNLVGGNYAYT